PNYRHSVPTKVLEYMAHGIPVIATPLPEVRRLLEDNNAGLIVPFDDPQAVVEAISALDRDGLRERCVQNGRRLVRDRFDWRQDAATLRRFYASVAAS
ncbi:MAG TPA: glycosyl transferase, partial [Acidimicrobiaceae bacterium]|nr:glycosyl transferase [Acidimicrobiaceae bacterium]